MHKQRALGVAAVVAVGSLIILKFLRRKKKVVRKAFPLPASSTFPPPPDPANYRKMSFEEADDSGSNKAKLYCHACSVAPIRLAATGIGSAQPETVRKRLRITNGRKIMAGLNWSHSLALHR